MYARSLLFIGLTVVAGCATDTRPIPVDARAVNTGTFPSFAPRPVAASRQLVDTEADARIGRLERKAATASVVGRPGPDQTNRLRRIRETHEAETLARISGS